MAAKEGALKIGGILSAILVSMVAAFWWLSIVSAAPSVVYVDATIGSNSTGNGLPAQPWKTISFAMTKVGAGDTIRVGPGTYDGTLGEVFPIEVKPGVSLVGSGQDATFIGPNQYTILIVSAQATDVLSNTVISDLTIQGAGLGMSVESRNGHLAEPTLRNLRIRNNYTGLMLYSGDVTRSAGGVLGGTVTNVELVSNRGLGLWLVADARAGNTQFKTTFIDLLVRLNGGDGILLSTFVLNPYAIDVFPNFIGAHVHHNHGNGLLFESHGSDFGFNLENSVIEDNDQAGIYLTRSGLSAAAQASITNSVIARNGGGGIEIYLGSPASATNYIHIANSTIIDNKVFGLAWDGSSELKVINSIVWNPGVNDWYAMGNYSATDQVTYSDLEDSPWNHLPGNFSVPPIWLDAYHQSACSATINAGTPVGSPPTDIDGDIRDNSPDVGADEYNVPCFLQTGQAVSASTVNFGEILTYTLALTNTASVTPVTVALTDALPTSLAYVSGTVAASRGAAIVSGQNITWSDTLAPGDTATVQFCGRVIQGGVAIQNYFIADGGPVGRYRSPDTQAVAAPLRLFIPALTRNWCSGPIVDDFSSPASGWPVATTTGWNYGYVSGEYRMLAQAADVFGAASRGDRGDFKSVEVDTRFVAGEGTFGLLFQLDDTWSEFYTFEVDPAHQAYLVWHFTGNSWHFVTGGYSSALAGPAVKRLGLALTGNNHYDLYANGTYLTGVNVPYVPGRRVGLTASAGSAGFDVRFDNYKAVRAECPDTSANAANGTQSVPALWFEMGRLPGKNGDR